MNLTVKQNISTTESATSALVDKLYELTKPDPITGQPIIDNAILVGRLSVPSAYEDAVNFLNTQFSSEQDNGSDFQISVQNNNFYIRFADANVLEALLNSDVGDGVGVSTTAAGLMGGKTNIFKDNTDIVTFDEIKYFTAQNISGWCFSGCTNLVSINIRNGIKPINDSFNSCTSLEYSEGINSEQGLLRLPEGTTETGSGAWQYTKFSKVVLPDSLTTINEWSLANMDSITDLYLGNGLTTWSIYSLQNITSLEAIHVKNAATLFNVTYGNICPFEGGRKLYQYIQYGEQETEVHNIVIPNNVTQIPAFIFGGQTGEAGCLSIQSITFHSGITAIGNWAFMNCKNLVIQDLNLPNLTILGPMAFVNTKIEIVTSLGSITSMGERTFDGCRQLVSVILPQTLITIDGFNFRNCNSLTSIAIPSSVTTIKNSCFGGCTNLTRVDITDMSAFISIDFSNTDANPLYNANNLYLNGSLATVADYTGKIKIKNYTFTNCKSIERVINTSSITDIGDCAFMAASNLTEVDIPQATTHVGWSAFTNTPNLTKFHGPSSVIGELNLPNLTSIGNAAFNNTGVKNIVSLGSVTSFYETFLGCSNLESVNLPNTLIDVGRRTFYSTKLTTLDIPDSATKIGWRCLYGCSLLRTVTFGISFNEIGSDVFNGCVALESITLKCTTPPTFSDTTSTNPLSLPSTILSTINIYVPSGYVSTYQSAAGWANYASRIQAIPNS